MGLLILYDGMRTAAKEYKNGLLNCFFVQTHTHTCDIEEGKKWNTRNKMCWVLLHICTCCIYKTHSMCCNYVSVCSILARDRKSVRRVRTTQSFWYDWLLVVVIGSFFSLHARLFFPYALLCYFLCGLFQSVFYVPSRRILSQVFSQMHRRKKRS